MSGLDRIFITIEPDRQSGLPPMMATARLCLNHSKNMLPDASRWDLSGPLLHLGPGNAPKGGVRPDDSRFLRTREPIEEESMQNMAIR